MNSLHSLLVVLYLFCFSRIIADTGDLIDYNYQESFSINSIEFMLGILGEDLPPPSYPISVYDVQYESHRSEDVIDTLSGLVCVPESRTKAFPILSYHHGTSLLDMNAPSITGLSFYNTEILLIGLATTSSGFITMIPDYEGIGDLEKFHPYIVADSYTRTVVNMISAVKLLSKELEGEDGFQYNEQLFLVGYSEGGYATLAAQRGIERDYNDMLKIAASLPMAGPYDLSGTMVDYILSNPIYPEPYYIPYVFTSHLWTYEGLEVDFNNYFKPFWADTLPSLYDGTHSGGEINSMMPENVLDILLDDVLDDFINNENHILRQTLEINTIIDWTPQSPTYLFHGIGDDIIPYENSQIAYNNFQNNGAQNVNIELFSEDLGGHGEVAIYCLLSGYNIMLDHQMINEKGDIDGDGIISEADFDFLILSIINDSDVTDFQWWTGDINYDNIHDIFDLLVIADMLD